MYIYSIYNKIVFFMLHKYLKTDFDDFLYVIKTNKTLKIILETNKTYTLIIISLIKNLTENIKVVKTHDCALRVTIVNIYKIINIYKKNIYAQKQITNKIITKSNKNKSITKTKRIFILYKKWKNVKWLYKMNKIKKFKQKTYNLNIKNIKNMNTKFKVLKNKTNRLSWNKITQYKNTRYLPIAKFKIIFFKWKHSNKQNNKFVSSSYKLNNIQTKKQLLTTTLINRLIKNLTKKLLIKKVKKMLSIRFKKFLKPKNFNLYQLNTKKTQVSHDKNNIVNQRSANFFKKNNLKSIYTNRKNFIKYNKSNFAVIKKNIKKNITPKSSLTNYKKNLIHELFIHNFKQTHGFKTSNNACITNMSLLTTNYFKTNRYNFYMHAILQNLIQPDRHSNVVWNCIMAKFKPTYTGLNSLTNYNPILHYSGAFNSVGVSSSHTNNVVLFRKFDKNTYKYFFINYIVNFLEKYMHKKIWIKIDTREPFNNFWKSYLFKFNQTYGYIYRRFGKLIASQELLEIFLLLCIKFDLQILLLYIKKKIESSHFKKHKKILSIIFDIIKKNKIILVLTEVKGFSFDIRGKVGVAGNAKKRHVYFALGKISTTSQNLKSQWQQISVWTQTGQMGITCLIQK
jgi:hypothetical protein